MTELKRMTKGEVLFLLVTALNSLEGADRKKVVGLMNDPLIKGFESEDSFILIGTDRQYIIKKGSNDSETPTN